MTYRILDLFCGAGGASTGYFRAGFEVTGVDIAPQPRYPFRFVQWDAIDVMENFADRLNDFDAIHASPPCQSYSAAKALPGLKRSYPSLIASMRELLTRKGLPYVIENVALARSEMKDPTMLCGSMFGLTSCWHGDIVYLQRHRLFETSFPLPSPGSCFHSLGRAVTVCGNGRIGVRNGDPYFYGEGYESLRREVMGIDWMNRKELNESIPIVYTEYVGGYLGRHLDKLSIETRARKRKLRKTVKEGQ